MKERRIRHINIIFPVLKSEVSVWIRSKEYIQEYFPSVDFSSCLGRTISISKGINPVIWLDESLPKEELVSILAHEAVHSVGYLLDNNGVERDEELMAYSVQYIVEQSIKRLSKLNIQTNE